MKEDDKNWPPPSKVGRQELEVVMGSEHISFSTAKIGSLLDVQSSNDPEGLRTFYYLVQVRQTLVYTVTQLLRLHPIVCKTAARTGLEPVTINERCCFVVLPTYAIPSYLCHSPGSQAVRLLAGHKVLRVLPNEPAFQDQAHIIG
eukprot:1730983-Pyramimonas_sp.AAC.2